MRSLLGTPKPPNRFGSVASRRAPSDTTLEPTQPCTNAQRQESTSTNASTHCVRGPCARCNWPCRPGIWPSKMQREVAQLCHLCVHLQGLLGPRACVAAVPTGARITQNSPRSQVQPGQAKCGDVDAVLARVRGMACLVPKRRPLKCMWFCKLSATREISPCCPPNRPSGGKHGHKVQKGGEGSKLGSKARVPGHTGAKPSESVMHRCTTAWHKLINGQPWCPPVLISNCLPRHSTMVASVKR